MTGPGPHSADTCRPSTRSLVSRLFLAAVTLGVLLGGSRTLLSAPGLSVTRRGVTPDGNLQWQVEVWPDAALLSATPEGNGGALAVEIGFQSTAGGRIIDLALNTELWPYTNPGFNPFTSGVTTGVWIDPVHGQAFVSIGSGLFRSGQPVELGTIVTADSAPSSLSWGGHDLLAGTKFHYVGGRIAQAGTNFNAVAGSLSQRLGDLDNDTDVDSDDLLQMLTGWTGFLNAPDPTVRFEQGDLDGDFDVDSGDLVLFISGWTGALAGREASQLVPEPVLPFWTLALAGGSLLARGRRRRKLDRMAP